MVYCKIKLGQVRLGQIKICICMNNEIKTP